MRQRSTLLSTTASFAAGFAAYTHTVNPDERNKDGHASSNTRASILRLPG